MRRILFVLCCLALFVGCKQERWDGFIYPDGRAQGEHVGVGSFESMEKCFAGTMMVRDYKYSMSAAIECGLNCTLAPGFPDTSICERLEVR